MLHNTETAPEGMPDAWNYCEIHSYPGDLLDVLFMITDTEQKVKFETRTEPNGGQVAKITPRNKEEYRQSDFIKVFRKVMEDYPETEILFY